MMRIKEIVNWSVLNQSKSKFSELTYKEVYGTH